MTVFANGKEFTSVVDKSVSVEETKTRIYDGIENLNKIELIVDDGFVIFGPEVIKNAIIMVTEK